MLKYNKTFLFNSSVKKTSQLENKLLIYASTVAIWTSGVWQHDYISQLKSLYLSADKNLAKKLGKKKLLKNWFF